MSPVSQTPAGSQPHQTSPAVRSPLQAVSTVLEHPDYCASIVSRYLCVGSEYGLAHLSRGLRSAKNKGCGLAAPLVHSLVSLSLQWPTRGLSCAIPSSFCCWIPSCPCRSRFWHRRLSTRRPFSPYPRLVPDPQLRLLDRFSPLFRPSLRW